MNIRLSDVEISLADTTEDIDILTDFRLWFLEEARNIDPEKRDLLRKAIREYYTGTLNTNYRGFIARHNGKPVAIAGYLIVLYPPHIDHLSRMHGVILNVYTLPQYRRNGISTAILKHLIKDAELQGISRLDLMATGMGYPLYQRLGFAELKDRAMQLKLQ